MVIVGFGGVGNVGGGVGGGGGGGWSLSLTVTVCEEGSPTV